MSKCAAYACICLLSVFAISCGGGSGSSSGENTPKETFSLRFEPGALSETWFAHRVAPSVTIKGYYQGTIPNADTIYIVANLNMALNDLAYGITESYAELVFFVNPDLAPGIHRGSVSIDLCADPQCNRQFGTRNILPYEIQILRNEPLFRYRAVGATEFEESSYDLVFTSEAGSEPPTYELTVLYPGLATNIVFPDHFLDLYQIEALTPDSFLITPPAYSPNLASKQYHFDFLGDDSLRQYPVTVHNRQINNNFPLVSSQVIFSSQSHTNLTDWPNRRPVSFDYEQCISSTLTFEVEKFTLGNWVEVIRESDNCFLDVTFKFQDLAFGIYEGEVNLQTAAGKKGRFSLIIAYSKNDSLIGMSSSALPQINAQTTEQSLMERQYFSIQSENGVHLPEAVSPWISQIRAETPDDHENFSYSLDINELKKINPALDARQTGVIKAMDASDPEVVGLIGVSLDIDVPFVYSAQPGTAAADTPFEISVRGSNFYGTLKGVEIIMLSVPDNSGAILESPFFHTVDTLWSDELTGDILFDMPPLAPGVYQLNFAGIFKEHFPSIYLTIE